MARDKIKVELTAIDNTQSVGTATTTKQTVNVANGISITNATANKKNSLFVIVDATTTGTITLKSGDAYPSACLGDLSLPIGVGINAIQLHDLGRFENKDGSVNLDFGGTFAGTVYAVAKRTGLQPVV